MPNQYDVGDTVRLKGTFTDTGGSFVDPTKVTMWVKAPSSTVLVATSTGSVAHPSTGVYTLDVSIGSSGMWRYRVYSTGSIVTAEENTFIIQRRFVPSTS